MGQHWEENCYWHVVLKLLVTYLINTKYAKEARFMEYVLYGSYHLATQWTEKN